MKDILMKLKDDLNNMSKNKQINLVIFLENHFYKLCNVIIENLNLDI